MAETKSFIEENKVAVLQELRGSISALQSLISEKLPETLRENEQIIPPDLNEVYVDMGLSMGYIVALFNELQTLEFGIDNEDGQEQAIGFAAMLNESENKS